MSDAAEDLARRFHETYEALAPSFNYKTRDASAVPWKEVPEANRSLMIAVCRVIIGKLPRNADAQTVEMQSRIWQYKTGVILSLVEEHGPPELFDRACAAMNIHWRTGGKDEGWDTAALAAYRAALRAAEAAGLPLDRGATAPQALLELEVRLLRERDTPGFPPLVWDAWLDHQRQTGHSDFDSDDNDEIRCRGCDESFGPATPEDFINKLLGIIQGALRDR